MTTNSSFDQEPKLNNATPKAVEARGSICLITLFCCLILSGLFYASDVPDTTEAIPDIKSFLKESMAEYDSREEGDLAAHCNELASKYIKGITTEALISAMKKGNFNSICIFELDTDPDVCEKRDYTLENFEETFWHKTGWVSIMHYLIITVEKGYVTNVRCSRG